MSNYGVTLPTILNSQPKVAEPAKPKLKINGNTYWLDDKLPNKKQCQRIDDLIAADILANINPRRR